MPGMRRPQHWAGAMSLPPASVPALMGGPPEWVRRCTASRPRALPEIGFGGMTSARGVEFLT